MLVLMRHAEASWEAATDKDRELTVAGIDLVVQQRKRFEQQISSVSRVVSSSYVRARQTTALLFEDVSGVEWVIDDRWSPDASINDAMSALEEHWVDNMWVVTHQPLIGYAVPFLIDGNTRSPEPLLPGQLVVLDLLWPGRASAMRIAL